MVEALEVDMGWSTAMHTVNQGFAAPSMGEKYPPCLDLCTEAARTDKLMLSLEFVALMIYPAAVTANILFGVAMEMMCLFQIWLYALVTLNRETRHWTRCTFQIGRAGEVVCLRTGWTFCGGSRSCRFSTCVER